MDTELAERVVGRAGPRTGEQDAARSGPLPGTRGRARVDGKLLLHGQQRLRVRGVTYGPFAPGPDGHPFPAPDRVDDDFARMRAAGVNAVRTYHVPPDRLLARAAEHGLALLVDVPWPKHL